MKHERGFTLMELSIVLVIIGLIVGGILVGSELIHNAELKIVIDEKEKIAQAVQTFKVKYKALPGDFPEATRIWGMAPDDTSPAADDDACAALTSTSPSKGKNTCNGNGNGRIGSVSGAEASEVFRVWQHLANAGLIEGTYTGVAGAGSVIEGKIGVNVLESKYNGLGWFMGWFTFENSEDSAGVTFNVDYNHAMVIGSEYPAAPNIYFGFSPKEMYEIDTKLDDGLPAKGNVMTAAAATDCHTGADANDFTATYKAESDAIVCTLIFRNLAF